MTSSYYDRPLLKGPVWTWEVPAYFFVGGAAGAASVIALVASLARGDAALAADARLLAAIGAVMSPALLISDLGRPARFLNMLRVIKTQSAMSVGAWTLAIFSAAAILSAALDFWAAARPAWILAIGHGADIVAAASGLVLATYTGVLIGATAIPAWSRHAAILPAIFGASSLGAAASILELVGHRIPALNALGLAAAAANTALAVVILRDRDAASTPLHHGASGRVVIGAEMLSGPLPLVARLCVAALPSAEIAAAACMIVGSLLTRIGWIAAGRSSADDPAVPLA